MSGHHTSGSPLPDHQRDLPSKWIPITLAMLTVLLLACLIPYLANSDSMDMAAKMKLLYAETSASPSQDQMPSMAH